MNGATPDEAAKAAALEAGRLLFARPWGFLRPVMSIAELPLPEGVEIAFAGRSNVGKSSLINALTGQNALARTSNAPGRTRALNFFGAGARLTIVDMPGYGYAAVTKTEVKAWTRLVFDYLRGRVNLRRVMVLIDARHGLKKNDLEALDELDRAAVSYQVVLTKIDKLKPAALERVAAETRAALSRRPAAYPEILLTSSETGEGIAELRATLAAMEPGEP